MPLYADLAIEILREKGIPLSTGQLWKAIGEREPSFKGNKAAYAACRGWLYRPPATAPIKEVPNSVPKSFVYVDQEDLFTYYQEQKDALTFLDCARKVLEEYGRPMHYQEITNVAIQKHWLRTKGRTPEYTMCAEIGRHIRTMQQRGLVPVFVQYGNGLYGLSAWLPQETPLHALTNKHTRELRKTLHERVMALPPKDVERLIGALLRKIGFEDVNVTRYVGDNGVDVHAVWKILDDFPLRFAIQVKRWTNNVQQPVVANLVGNLAHTTVRGVIITTSDFSDGARKFAQENGIWLIDGEKLISLLIEYRLGVSPMEGGLADEIDFLKLEVCEDLNATIEKVETQL